MAPKNPPPRQPPVGYPNTNPLRKEEQITAGNRFFRDQHTTFSPKEWYDHVYRHAEEYKTCSVLSFTQFKDLNSRYKHEYISFLVEDSVTQLRAQIIAERDTNRDVVFVGQMKKPPSSDKPLALRLRTLVFSKTNRPAIIAVAVILVSFSKVGGKYQLLFNNCFWFSRTIHKVLKVHYGDASETLSTKIKPGDFTYPSLFKNSFTVSLTFAQRIVLRINLQNQAKAKQFVEEQNKEWDVIQETIILVANKKKFIAELAEQQKLKNYKDSMSHIGFDVDEAAVSTPLLQCGHANSASRW